MSKLNEKKDLTRWNRAGLSRFRYVDGNAVTFLETLRLAMIENFTDDEGINRWQALDAEEGTSGQETTVARQARRLKQYRAERRDYGWEILRTYARAAHVLGEYLNAYANESYLGTATQWDHVRRLVEMLDYHPAPPASAETPIVLLAKSGKSGTVPAGFAFKNKPEDGSKPSIFETLDDLEVDHRMNALRPADWNRSQQPFFYAEGTWTATFPLSRPTEDVSAGTLGVLVIEKPGGSPLGIAVKVTGVTPQALTLQGESKPAGYPAQVLLSDVRLLLKPEFRQAPRLVGEKVVILEEDHQLSTGAVVAWQEGGAWQAARVKQLQHDRAELSRTAPAAGTELYLALRSETRMMKEGVSSESRVVLPAKQSGDREDGAVFDSGLQKIGGVETHAPGGNTIYDYLLGTSHSHAYYVPKAGGAKFVAGRVKVSRPDGLIFDGSPEGLVSGGWVIGETSAGIHGTQIASLEESEKTFSLELLKTLSGVQLLHGDFAFDIRPKDHDVNEDPIFLTSPAMRSDSHSVVPLELNEFPDLLDTGRILMVAGRDAAMAVTVKEVNPEGGWIRVSPAIPGSGLSASGTTSTYTRGHTVLYGNVVASGHGESQSEKILGSGDATRSRQQFDLDVEGISFVADRDFPNGVRAAVDVRVEGRTWKQVATLNQSEPADPHYVVRMKQDGTLLLEFGDGRHGRRLPSGTNNLRVRYRTGAGLSGNLAAYSLEKEVKPHPYIESVLQPMAAAGGNDMEPVESMRENAPAGVLALERAVSLADFTHLAANNSGVWQARAIRKQPGPGRAEQIEVAVVPAGGGSLGALGETLEKYLTARALPNVQVSVVRHQSIILDLAVTLQVNSEEYDHDLTAEATRRALFRSFALQKMKLGETFYSSRVFAVVESVEGVASCRCVINPSGFRDDSGAPAMPRQVGLGREGQIRRISLEETQVIHMDEGLSILEITVQEYQL